MAGEHGESKAGRFVDELLRHPLTPKEIAEMGRPIGDLRLSSDIPSVELDDATGAREVVAHITEKDSEATIALTEPDKGAIAVVMTARRYLELVDMAIKRSPPVGLNELAPTRQAVLPVLYVEEVTPPDAPLHRRAD